MPGGSSIRDKDDLRPPGPDPARLPTARHQQGDDWHAMRQSSPLIAFVVGPGYADYLSRVRAICGIELACANIEVPA